MGNSAIPREVKDIVQVSHGRDGTNADGHHVILAINPISKSSLTSFAFKRLDIMVESVVRGLPGATRAVRGRVVVNFWIYLAILPRFEVVSASAALRRPAVVAPCGSHICP